MSLQYVIFLIGVRDVQEAEGTTVANGLHKDTVLHLASVIEASLFHCLKTGIQRGFISESVMPVETTYSRPVTIFKDMTNKVVGALQHNRRKQISGHVQFQDLVRSCQRAQILDAQLAADVDQIRQDRNKIHLASLSQVDDKWGSADVSRVMAVVTKVADRVEAVLKTYAVSAAG